MIGSYKKSLTITVFCALLVFTTFAALIFTHRTTTALSGSEFNPGRIIDDSVFYNSTAMSPSQIQAFLDSKVPVCDTNGTQSTRGTTRALYGASVGHPAPYTCLKDYTEAVPQITNGGSDLCTQSISAGTKTAAQIIYDAAQACGINPQVLIVLLQKEQSLITDDWPWTTQYRSATGYGCPDTAPCDAEYYGFFNQVYQAAKAYRRYEANPNSYNYKAHRNNYVGYHPNSACGGSTIFIENQATANLYVYTPYQPNAAALSNLYGSGDSCSAYGNRNFWRMFNDWFGSTTTSAIVSGVSMSITEQPDATPFRGQTVTYRISLVNNLSTNVVLDAVGIVGRQGSLDNGANRDFGWQGPITLVPGVAQQFTFTRTILDVGAIYAWPAINHQGTYIHYNNWGTAMNARLPNLTLTSPFTSSLTSPIEGQASTLSATIRNNETEAISMDALGIPVLYFDTYRYDVAWTATPGGIPAGSSQAVSGNVTFDKPGPYKAWLSGIIAGQFTTLAPAINVTVAKKVPKFSLSYLETPNPSPALGEDVTVKFKLKNNSGIAITLDAVGVVGRYGNPYTGANRDFGWEGPVTFAAGEEKSFTTLQSNVTELKDFYSWVAINYNGQYTHYNNWGFVLAPRTPNISASVPLTINSGSPPSIGAPSPVTVTLKNNEPKPIRYSAIGIPSRYFGVYNYDVIWEGSGTLAASGSVGDTKVISGSTVFDKPGPYTVWPSVNIANTYTTIGTQSEINL